MYLSVVLSASRVCGIRNCFRGCGGGFRFLSSHRRRRRCDRQGEEGGINQSRYRLPLQPSLSHWFGFEETEGDAKEGGREEVREGGGIAPYL